MIITNEETDRNTGRTTRLMLAMALEVSKGNRVTYVARKESLSRDQVERHFTRIFGQWDGWRSLVQCKSISTPLPVMSCSRDDLIYVDHAVLPFLGEQI